jgi:hypothetical protein
MGGASFGGVLFQDVSGASDRGKQNNEEFKWEGQLKLREEWICDEAATSLLYVCKKVCLLLGSYLPESHTGKKNKF